MLKFFIKGFDPVAEASKAMEHFGAYEGQPVMCKGIQGHVWHYVYTNGTVRKPAEIEAYLFRGKTFDVTK